jgi:hypothetical protein
MKMMHVTTVVVSALTMLLLAPLEAGAGGHGFGIHSFHVRGHFRSVHHHFRLARHHRGFGLWPLYGYYDWPPYTLDDAMTYSTPDPVVLAPEPPRAVGCQHSQQTVTVPSENGEPRQVTIIRC